MKKLFLLCSLVLSVTNAWTSSDVVWNDVYENFIDHGLATAKDQFPSVVRVVTYGPDKNMKPVMLSICTGTLITQRIVLTASHCLPKNASQHLRVSLTGDPLGLTDNNFFAVSHYFGATGYVKNIDKFNANEMAIKTPEFPRLSAAEKEFIQSQAILLSKDATSYDFAFLELAKPQPISASNTASLGCFILPVNTAVSIVGYGINNMSTGPTKNINTAFQLLHGSNVLVKTSTPKLTMRIEKRIGSQLINHGDSGGPLFRKDNFYYVYGVVSTVATDPKTGIGMAGNYAATGSDRAREFYREILTHNNASTELKRMVRKCLDYL